MPIPMASYRPSRGRAVNQGSPAEQHAHRHPFGDVVQGDGQHQQGGAVPIGLGPSASSLLKLMCRWRNLSNM